MNRPQAEPAFPEGKREGQQPNKGRKEKHMRHLAVFGHYDSRGGTMAFTLEELTEQALQEARNKYDATFCLSKEDLEEFGRPSTPDFLFVAQLHGEIPEKDPDNWGLDLEETGYVLIDTTNEPKEEGITNEQALANIVQLEYLAREDNKNDQVLQEQERQDINAAKFLTGDKIEYRVWDDDAFGFVIDPRP